MTPTTLSDVQALMGEALVRTVPIEDDAAMARATARIVAPGLRLSPVEQLEIYREQFWLRHIGAMKEDFVTIHRLLGEDRFRVLCESYLAAHPPASFTLRDLGDRFAEFVQRTEPWASDALLRDCARLEWAFVDAFDAPDAPPLDPRSIAEAPEEAWSGAKVVLHPSVQLVAMAHPAQVFRAALRDETNPDSVPMRPLAEATHVVVYRGPEKLMYIAIEALAFDLLERLARGVPLAPACEEVALGAGVTDASELEAKVGAWFQAWAAYGWVTRVEFSASHRPG